jgi:hypothetical protein
MDEADLVRSQDYRAAIEPRLDTLAERLRP